MFVGVYLADSTAIPVRDSDRNWAVVFVFVLGYIYVYIYGVMFEFGCENCLDVPVSVWITIRFEDEVILAFVSWTIHSASWPAS